MVQFLLTYLKVQYFWTNSLVPKSRVHLWALYLGPKHWVHYWTLKLDPSIGPKVLDLFSLDPSMVHYLWVHSLDPKALGISGPIFGSIHWTLIYFTGPLGLVILDL